MVFTRTATLANTLGLIAMAFRWGYFETATTPQGPSPTFTFFVTLRLPRFTMETSFDGPFALNKVLESGESAMPQGRSPISNDAVTLLVAVSITKSLCPRPVLT